MSATSPSPRNRWIWIGLVIFLCAAAGMLIYPLVRPDDKATCEAHLRQIALALQNYDDEHGSFPPAYTLGPDGKPWHSWRVLILPQLGEEKLYKEYRFDEPWDTEHNLTLVNRMPAAFGCPANRNGSGTTPYLAVVGERTVWPGPNTQNLERIEVNKGASNTILLMEADSSDVVWIEPRDLSVEAASEAFQQGGPHRHVAMCDGSVHTPVATVGQKTFLSVLNSGSRRSMGPQDRLPPWLRGKMPAEVASWGPTKVASELRSTEVVGAANLPLDAGKSQIWCATFQMAWDQLREKCGGSEVTLQPAIPLSDALNEHSFRTQALSPECVLLHAAPPGPEDDRRLRAELAERFPDAPVRIEDSQDNPLQLRIFAYLEKRLLFFDGLERFPEPLRFGDSPPTAVDSFGVKPTKSEGEGTRILENEVFIRDYLSDDDFILELATESKRQDRVILARVAPSESLAETWSHVEKRIKTPDARHRRRNLMSTETFQAPVLAFNVHREYEELVDQWIQSCPDSDSPPIEIQVARQGIRFRLDERGATLLSLAEIEASTLDGGPSPRRFIFDRPFLLALREGDNEPYFLAWIATAEVMEKKTQ
jgi:hypothetical protein